MASEHPHPASDDRARAASEPSSRGGMRMVAVPGGAITLRDARSEASRTVELAAFEIGATPVSIGEWNAMLEAAAAHGVASGAQAPVSMPVEAGGRVPAHPVTWFDAVRWCNAASLASGYRPAYALAERTVTWDVSAEGYRLPTEAEWEFACRAGSVGPRYGALGDIAWTMVDGVHGPQPVAQKAANGLGLFDTLGNVWEWCWDYADTARYGDYRSLRGGGWADREWSCRASVRRGSAPDAVLEDVGFRIARGAVAAPGATAAQGWSHEADRQRADVRGPRPVGWTPLRF